jgi:amino acid adenylation domain-containing protein
MDPADRPESLVAANLADDMARAVPTSPDRLRVLAGWNATARNYPRNACIHDLLEAQAERAPDAIAVAFEGRELSYAALNRQGNQLAHRLRELGVGPEVLVGLCMERSLEMVVATLAILKAGGAYLPLDPAYPAARLAHMLADARSPVLLTQRRLEPRLLGEAARRMVVVDAEREALARLPDQNVPSGALAGNLAYVMYTSGSTGRPKGVCVTHRNVLRLVKGVDFAELNEREVVLQFAPISFDPATFEIWGSLLNGARLVVYPAASPSLAELAAFIEREGITTLWLTAGLFRQLADRYLPALRSVRQLLAGGDVLPVPVARKVVRELPTCQLINGYGPTENTTFTCCHRVTPDDALDPSVPIGRPIANTQAFVLDAGLRPLPVGMVGELYAGGDGLARGYFNRPDITAERFIPNPWSDTPGARLYRTGDLARHRADGSIEFVGRIDSQVKIRGFRVEPGEIETALAAHPAVRQVVVVPRGDAPDDKMLVCYLVPAAEAAPTPKELRAFLGARLPAQMVPSLFVTLETLPLTPNGKVDLAALPEPGRARPGLETARVDARAPEEADLAAIWSEVLHVDAPGVHDDFFDLGGHSLAATQVVARVREVFGVDLPLAAVFDKPTISALAERIAMGRQREQTVVQATPRGRDLPLSTAQERVWFLQQLDPSNRSYHFQATLRLRGDLDVTALERSLEEIVRRHEILRTTFPAVDGRPIQSIHPAAPLHLPLIDFEALGAQEPEAAAQGFIEDELRQPFDLTRLPLVRWTLLRLRAREHILLHVEHHLVHDGWSLNVLLGEIAALYRAFAAGRPSPLPEPEIQFADFAHRQRRWLKTGVAEGQIAYWKRRLAGCPVLLDLPRDHPRPAVQRYRGTACRIELPSSLCAVLRGFSRREGVTLFMTLLAALQTLLRRYSGQDDFCIGSGIANRRWRETEGMIGMVINTVALRADLSGNPTFRELLARTRRTTLEAYDHQDVPFDSVVEALQPARDLSHNPIFQVMLGFHDSPLKPLDLPGLEVELLEALSNGSSKFDLNLTVIPRAEQRPGPPSARMLEGITLIWEYNTDLFDAATVDRMIVHFRTLLEGILERPDRRIADLPLFGEAERRTLTAWAARNSAAAGPEVCLPALFEAQVKRTPEATAVVHGDESLTYRALNRRANELAHRLRNLGVGPEIRVALCVDRSPEMIVGLLGILKAGGAYVPLDPTHPRERLAFLLCDAAPRLLLSHSHLGGALPACDLPVVLLDGGPGRLGTDHEHLDGESRADPSFTVDPAHLAYVIYTSGSTGAPKGVEITHGALAGTLRVLRDTLGLSADDCLLAVTTLGFDIAALEIFLPLVVGAHVALARREEAVDGAQLIERLAASKPTVMQATPSTWRMLLEAGWPGAAHLKLLCGGEVLPRELAAQLLERGAALWNLYGPTEATIWCTAQRMNEEIEEGCIGRPIPGMEAHVLDASLQPAPLGVPGELYLGGVGLARGYLEQPELTAERFIPHPFGDAPGARLYRTGDRARWRPDGTLEYLGRDDGQVKLRGFRIELGEIEAALRAYPAVADAAAAMREERPGDARLVAYVVASAPEVSQEALVAALRAHLAERLPDYMLPAAYVKVACLPLTPNGKVDRKALPAPEWGPRREAGDAAALPRTPVEEALALIWAETLGVEGIGPHDDFFAAGGHSLLATQIMARLRQTFRVHLPLVRLFETRTVARLAAAIESARGREAAAAAEVVATAPEASSALVPDPERRHEPFPLTDVQEAYWAGRSGAFALGNVATHAYLEVECDGLDLERFERAWRRLIERHDMLRAIVLPSGKQRVLPEVPPYEIETLDLRRLEPQIARERAAGVRAEMSHRVLPSDRWPLFEIRATRLDGNRTLLHIGLDALILDAWSVRILFAEMSRVYEDPEIVLPALGLSYRDYVLADLGRRDTETYRRSLAYWQDRLPGLPPGPDLPLARRPDQLTRPRFTRRSARLAPEAWQRLKTRTMSSGLTPSAVLLTAYAEVLGTWSKKACFTLNLTLFNRLPIHPHVGALVGDFTSLTMLEVENALGGPFEARARRLQEQLWQDLDHREVSGVRVLRDLARARHMPAGPSPPLMPVVFTSTLNLSALGHDGSPWSWLGTVVYSVTQTPQVWLDHQVALQGGALVLNWDAVDDLFPPALMDEMLGAYQSLLRRLADDPEAWREEERSLVPAGQIARRQEVNATAAPVSTAMLHTLFSARAEERPDRQAVVTARRTLTYAELTHLAARIGRRLRQEGARPNTLIAVVMEKGWEQIAAVLGVLTSGAAYLPIDPALPPERLARLLRHGEAALALTTARLNSALAWPSGVRRIRVDEIAQAEEKDADLPPDSIGEDAGRAPLTPDDLAYVIHTSGSTGPPKGVMIDHRAAVNTILDINERSGVGPDDRVLALSSLSFDLSVYDIFGVLAAGGTVVVPEPHAARDPARWAELLASERVSVWNSVPALMNLLIEYLASRGERLPSALRLVMLSGDWIPVTLPDRIRALAPNARVVGLGGATEASIWSIRCPIDAVDPAWASIPYGWPLRNQTFHVLNETLGPCPTWVSGELYIGGIGLARGYWRDAERTAASFITHPQTGERLYRTGDFGRYLPDGSIEFLGRDDSQVKIQGYRVELGEIESVLAQHPGVRLAVATAVGEPRGERRLAAYVVPADGRATVVALREYLEERLPAYMQPSAIVFVETLPLTPNGKVDRQALRPPTPSDGAAAGAPPLERRETTQRIAEIVGRILALDRIQTDASLLDLGANSIDMVRIANLAEQELGFRPRVDVLYREPTVAALARGYEEHLARLVAGARGGAAEDGSGAPSEGVMPGQAILRDPEERAAFKDRQPGLRLDLPADRSSVRLTMGADADGRVAARRSHRHFAVEPVPLRRLEGLLSCLRQTTEAGIPRYLYPSAGGLYPVQTYLHLKPGRVEGMGPGLYYHHPVEHRLALLAPDLIIDRTIHVPLVNSPIFDEAAFSIFLVARLAAIAPMYGEQARDFCLLEAGAMLQLLMLAAAEHDLGLCPIGRLEFERIRPAFGLDESHFLAHSLLGGITARGRAAPESSTPAVDDRASAPLDGREEAEF